MEMEEDDMLSNSELPSDLFNDLLDYIIIDVVSEYHRIARLGLDSYLDKQDEELRLSAEARAKVSDPSQSDVANGKYVVDIFGQTHPAIASEVFECMNCGRSIAAGRFAPHLEKCMGKGRKARMKSTRSTATAQRPYSRGSPLSNSSEVRRLPNGRTGNYSNGNVKKQ